MSERYHVWVIGSTCACEGLCGQCGQCRCETGRKRLCPGFNVKQFPAGYEHWKIDREIERLEGIRDYARKMATKKYREIWARIEELELEKKRLASAD